MIYWNNLALVTKQLHWLMAETPFTVPDTPDRRLLAMDLVTAGPDLDLTAGLHSTGSWQHTGGGMVGTVPLRGAGTYWNSPCIL